MPPSGLAAWGVCGIGALAQLQRASNAQLYLDSQLSAEDVLSFGIRTAAIATGRAGVTMVWGGFIVTRSIISQGTTVGVMHCSKTAHYCAYERWSGRRLR